MISDIFQNNNGMWMLVLAQNLFKPGWAGRQNGLVGLDGGPGGPRAGALVMHPQGHVAQDFTGEKFVKGLGQFLTVIDTGQAKVLGRPNIHGGVHFDTWTIWEQTLKCRIFSQIQSSVFLSGQGAKASAESSEASKQLSLFFQAHSADFWIFFSQKKP